MTSAEVLVERRLAACPHCDLLLRLPGFSSAHLRCHRCGGSLGATASKHFQAALPIYLAAGVCLLLANLFPIVAIEAAGSKLEATLLGAVRALLAQQMSAVAIVVFATTILIPAVELAASIWLLLAARAQSLSGVSKWLYRLRESSRPWSMLEIFMLGALVAIVKLGSLASIVLGPGIGFLAAFMILSGVASHLFLPEAFWQRAHRRP